MATWARTTSYESKMIITGHSGYCANSRWALSRVQVQLATELAPRYYDEEAIRIVSIRAMADLRAVVFDVIFRLCSNKLLVPWRLRRDAPVAFWIGWLRK